MTKRIWMVLTVLLYACTNSPPPITQTLSVTVQGPGEVQIEGTQTSCKATCQLSLQQGKQLKLQAHPEETSVFIHWEGDCTSNLPVCVIVMQQDRQATAHFLDVPQDAFEVVFPAQLLVVPRGEARKYMVFLDKNTSIPGHAFQVDVNSALVGTGEDQVQFQFLPEQSSMQKLVFSLASGSTTSITNAAAVFTVQAGRTTRSVPFTLSVVQ